MRKLTTLFSLIILVMNIARPQVSVSGVVNIYTPVTSIDYCSNTVSVLSAAGFSAGDRVMIIQMKGAEVSLANTASFGNITSYHDAGNYEFATVNSITGTLVQLENKLMRTYTPSEKVQLVKVAVYEDVDVDGILTAPAWNGSFGGVVVLEADVLTLNADIDVSEKGFRGGDAGNFPESCPSGTGTSLYYSDTLSGKGGEKGEGIVNLAGNYLACRGKAVNGGGGGNDHNAGAGGGANGNTAGVGGENDEAFFSCPGSPGLAGIALDHTMAADKVFLGGGGGAGHGNNTNGTNGGDGGGIVIIMVNQLIGNGYSIISNGGTVTDLAWGDGAGGGGAGGSIIIEATEVNDVSFIAKGGDGGDAGSTQCTGPGGGGSGGVIKHNGAVIWPGVTSDLSGGSYGVVATATSPCFGENNGAANGGNGIIVSSLEFAESIMTFDPDFAFAGNDTMLCDGSGIKLTGTGGVSYEWSPSTYLDNPLIANPNCTPFATITYVLEVTDENGCIDFDTITITVAPPVVADAGDDITLCAGESVTIYATGGISYIWSPSVYLSETDVPNPVCTPEENITYAVTVIDENGCSGVDTIQVMVNSSDFLSVSDDIAVCDGGSAELFATGGVTYLWSPSTYLDDASSPNPLCTPSDDITYYVASVSAEGCEDIDTINVTISVADFLTTGDDVIICAGSSTELNATGGVTYLWSPSTYLDDATSANPVCTPLTDMVYTVTSLNAEGCTDEETISVMLLPADFATVDAEEIVCVDGSVVLNASGGVNYSWSPSTYLDDATSPDPVCTPLTDILYVVSVESADGCTDTDSVMVSLLPAVEAEAGPDTVVCSGGQIQLFASGGVEYVWTPSTYLDSPTSSHPFCTLVESISYVVWITDENGCTATDTVDVEVVPSPDIIAGDDITICKGDTIELNAEGGISYTWSPEPLFACGTCETASFSPVETTTYLVIGENAGGCSASDFVTVTVDICNGMNNISSMEINIYPNPARDVLFIELPAEIHATDIVITDIAGQHIPFEISQIKNTICQVTITTPLQPMIVHVRSGSSIYSKLVIAGSE